jgi:hypothetical protein
VSSALSDLYPELAFELIRPPKGEHIRIYANGKVEISPISADVANFKAETIINNLIPSLLREAYSEGRYG